MTITYNKRETANILSAHQQDGGYINNYDFTGENYDIKKHKNRQAIDTSKGQQL